jgi:hypothetical protein
VNWGVVIKSDCSDSGVPGAVVDGDCSPQTTGILMEPGWLPRLEDGCSRH